MSLDPLRARFWTQLLLAAFLTSRVASSQSARDHFTRGLAQVQNGQLEAAVLEFEAAYRIKPHYAVLYNLGQTHAALAQPAQALRAFESYLADGAEKIPAARRSEVERRIAELQTKVGTLELAIEPSDADLFIDGVLVTKPTPQPFRLSVGSHALTVTSPGFQPYVSRVEVRRQQAVTQTITLAPESCSEVSKPTQLGQLAVLSSLPSVTVWLDGSAVEPRGADLRLVPLGVHQVRCTRSDYVPYETQVEVLAEKVTRVRCDLLPLPTLTFAQQGILTFDVSEPNAELYIDGRRSATTTVRLPEGPHSTLVRRGGFIDWQQVVVARPSFPQTIPVRLQSTPEHAADIRRARATRRTWAYVLGGTGVALLGTGVALYVTNGPRYQRWLQDRDALSGDIADQRPPSDLIDRSLALQQAATSIQRQDDIALGVSVLGGALVSYAALSLLTQP